jgi:hypothetical protein
MSCTSGVAGFTVRAGTRLTLSVSGLVFRAADGVMEVEGDEQTIAATATDDFQELGSVRHRRFRDVEPEILNLDNSIWLPDAPID